MSSGFNINCKKNYIIIFIQIYYNPIDKNDKKNNLQKYIEIFLSTIKMILILISSLHFFCKIKNLKINVQKSSNEILSSNRYPLVITNKMFEIVHKIY